MMITRAGFLSVWVISIMAGTLVADEPLAVVFEVEAGAHDRRDTPLSVPLPGSMSDAPGFALENLETHKYEPVQKTAHQAKGGGSGVMWILREPLRAGTTRRYRLSTDTSKAALPADGGVRAFVDGQPLEHNRGGLDDRKTGSLRVGDRPVLTYLAAVAEPPAGIPSFYRRSGFIHPLQTPSGVIVTDDFSPEHAHQHGLFFAWVNTTFEGRNVDFWNQAKKTGNVRQEASGALYKNMIAGGPVFGELQAALIHEDLTAPSGPKPVLRDLWLVLVYDVAGHFLIDFQSSQHIIGEKLTVNKYHYGGLGLRGNRQWFDATAQGDTPPDPAKRGESDFLTSEGKHRLDGNHTRPRWADLSGKVDGKFAGISILDHPSNFRFPQPVRLHPTMPYFCFAPMVEEEFAITRGHPYVSHYRLVIHDGPADPKVIERFWHDYAEPPRVTLIEEKR